MIHSNPSMGETNFHGKEITLVFDEAINLNNPKEQIIVIPDINKQYAATVRKNSVKIVLDTKLDDSTTYSLNFRDAVQDMTEKNIPTNLKIAFSTGNYIDSLSISGKTFDAIKGIELKEITVAIFQSDTFNVLRHKPVYITKSDKKGNYALENLKPGRYLIYAFEDKNKNLIVDSKNELYGFHADTISLSVNKKNVDLNIIKLDVRPLKLTSARPYNTYFNIKTGKSLTRYTLTSEQPISSSFGDDQANIKVYNIYQNNDSIPARFTGIDSANNTIDTTFYIKFSERAAKPESFQHKSLGTKVIAQTGTLTSRIKFTKPLHSINFDSIYYTIDSTLSIPITPTDISWDSLNNILSINKSIDKKLLAEPINTTLPKPEEPAIKKLYQLNIARASFISIENDSSARIQETARPITPENSGIIIVHTAITNNNFIIQLRDRNYAVLESKLNTPKTQFDNIAPGEYLISLILDTDNNGKWSPGNIIKGIEPERIIYYRNEKQNPIINLKANWELGPLLITN